MPPPDQVDARWLLLALALLFACFGASVRAWVAFIRARRRAPQAPALASPIPAAPALPWRASTLLLTIVAYLVVRDVAATALAAQSASSTEANSLDFNANPHLLILLGTLVNLALVLVIPPLIRASSGHGFRALGLTFDQNAARDARFGVNTLLLVAPFVFGLFFVATTVWPPEPHPVSKVIVQQGATSAAALALVSAVVAAPIAEELLFRGVFLGWLVTAARRGLAPAGALDLAIPPAKAAAAFWVPNALVSLVFASLHANAWPAPIPLFFLSLMLGWLVHVTGRLTAPIAAHAAFNAFSTVLFLLSTQAGLRAP
jgi:membrane protease YdiL (CAAX protease family)